MSRYIDADELKKLIRIDNPHFSRIHFENIVNQTPTADVVPKRAYDMVLYRLQQLQSLLDSRNSNGEPVRHGHWIKYDRYAVDSDGKPVLKIGEEYECSLCGRTEEKEELYCNCDAKMDGEGNN